MATEEGVWLYDAQGRERFSPRTSNVTVLGIVNSGQSNGSITNANLAKGKPVLVQIIPVAGQSYSVPTVWFSGTTLYWQFRTSGASSNQAVRIYYGIRA